MTETTQTQKLSPPGGAKPHTPEYRVVLDAWHRLRQDLFHDAFAYRPLPRMRMDGLLTRRLSGQRREYVSWAPHAAVVTAALLAATIAVSASDRGEFGTLVTTALTVVPILLTLVRPIGAFWVSMAATPVTAVFSDMWSDWPWAPGSFAAHLVVLTVVALRTPPRTAAWTWALTAAYGLFVESILGAGHYSSNKVEQDRVGALLLERGH